MTTYNRAAFAANALVAIEISFGILSFWSDALARGGAIDYVVAALLTVAFGSVSLLASSVVTRFAEAKEAGELVTQRLVAFCGLVLVLIAGGCTWHGLTWLDERTELGPDWLLVVASFLLSCFNVVSFYVFVRSIPKPKAQTVSQAGSLDAAIFGKPEPQRPVLPTAAPAPIKDQEIASIVTNIEAAVAKRRKAVA